MNKPYRMRSSSQTERYPYTSKDNPFIQEYKERTEILSPAGFTPDFRMPEPREVIIEKKPADVKEQRRWVKAELVSPIEPLKFVSEQVVGDLFDRVEFLKHRIEELNAALSDRILLNKKFIEDVNSDIDEKQRMLQATSDREEIRELKLDITLLKMEKRREMNSFWKDTLELRKEIQRLSEEFRIESKIANLFGKK